MTDISFSRRALLQAMFYGGGAVFLAACGGGSSSTTGSGDVPADPTLPTPKPPIEPEPLLKEFPLKPGPLFSIGELVKSDVDGIFIPEGFSIRRVAVSGTAPAGGLFNGKIDYIWHGFPDGGAVFPAAEDGGWVYVSNSETVTAGGVGALRFDRNGNLIDAYRILRGTRRNCAGGATPWGTWLSCEEVADGYVYECDPLGTPATAVKYPALGVFNHEAAAVDMETRTVFLTEDEGDGRLYRFVSSGTVSGINGREALDLQNGVLQVLEVEGFENGGYLEDLELARRVCRVRWVEVVEPGRAQGTVRKQIERNTGVGAPGTRFPGGEGIWMQHLPADARPRLPGAKYPLRAVAFFATKGDNRVYALDIDNDLLEVVFDNQQLEGVSEPFADVDNVTVSPAGDVIVAEDGDAMRLMVVHPNKGAKILVRVPGGGSELTGPAFTPDGSRLYFSSQRGPRPIGFGVTYELTIPEAFRNGS